MSEPLPKDVIKAAAMVQAKLRKNFTLEELRIYLETDEHRDRIVPLLQRAIPQLSESYRQKNKVERGKEYTDAIKRILDYKGEVYDEIALTFQDLSSTAQKGKKRLVAELRKRLGTDELQEVSVENFAMMLENFDNRMHESVVALFLFASGGATQDDEEVQEFRQHLPGAIRNMAAAFLLCQRRGTLVWMNHKRYQKRLENLRQNVKTRDFHGTFDVSELKKKKPKDPMRFASPDAETVAALPRLDASGEADPEQLYRTMRFQGPSLPDAQEHLVIPEAPGEDWKKLYETLYGASEILLETDLPVTEVDPEGVLRVYMILAQNRKDDVVQILESFEARFVGQEIPQDDKNRVRVFMAMHFLTLFPELNARFASLIEAIKAYAKNEDRRTIASDHFARLKERSERTTTQMSIVLPRSAETEERIEGEISASFYGFLNQVEKMQLSALSNRVRQRQLDSYVKEFVPRMAHFELEGVLGLGGFAVVVKARSIHDDSVVAAKIMLPSMEKIDPEARQDVAKEAAMASKIQHPNVVKVLEMTEIPRPDGPSYPVILSEYIDGNDAYEALIGPKGVLSRYQIVEDKESMSAVDAIPAKAVLLLFQEILRGVVATHQAGLTHYDLKFENIMIHEEVISELEERAHLNAAGEQGPFLTAAEIIQVFQEAPEGWAKVTDYGSAVHTGSEYPYGMNATLRYACAEMLSNITAENPMIVDTAHDIEVVGKLLYEIFTMQGSVPAIVHRAREFAQARFDLVTEALKTNDPALVERARQAVNLDKATNKTLSEIDLQQELSSYEYGLLSISDIPELPAKKDLFPLVMALKTPTEGSLISAQDPVIRGMRQSRANQLVHSLILQATHTDHSQRASAQQLLDQVGAALSRWDQFESPVEQTESSVEQAGISQEMIYMLVLAAFLGAMGLAGLMHLILNR